MPDKKTLSAYYDWLTRPPSKRTLKDRAVLRELVRLHQKYPTLGLDSLHQLTKPKIPCSRGKVHKLMKQANIHSKRKKAYKCTTNSKHTKPVAPNLLKRDFSCNEPNRVWVSDITYIPTGEGWLYLAVVKDLCLKKVVGYAFSNRIDTKLVLDALHMAVKRQNPKKGLIFHSDRGVQYCSKDFSNALYRLQFLQSMSRKGDPYDNAVAENFFSCLKCECTHLTYFPTRSSAQTEIFRYIEVFYNRFRPHSGIRWLAPIVFELLLLEGKNECLSFSS